MRTPARILIVDDNLTNVKVLQTRLAAEGYEIVTAADGEEGLAAARQHTPDLILLDVKLIEEDGRVICKQLKTNEQTKDVPIIMLSAHVSERKIRQECPVDDFLAKPFELDTLLCKVEKHLH